MTIDSMDALRNVYRLRGTDAPETQKTCPVGWPAGRLESASMPTDA